MVLERLSRGTVLTSLQKLRALHNNDLSRRRPLSRGGAETENRTVENRREIKCSNNRVRDKNAKQRRGGRRKCRKIKMTQGPSGHKGGARKGEKGLHELNTSDTREEMCRVITKSRSD